MGDDDYFASYGDLETHELMLKDAPRLAAYAAAVEANASFIRGRAVLDVGAGTGILSLLCARAGARVPSPPNFRGRLASSAAQPLPPTR